MSERPKHQPRSEISLFPEDLRNGLKDAQAFQIAPKLQFMPDAIPGFFHEFWRTGREAEIYTLAYDLRRNLGLNISIKRYHRGMMNLVNGLILMGETQENIECFVSETLPVWERGMRGLPDSQPLDPVTTAAIERSARIIVDGGRVLSEMPHWQDGREGNNPWFS